ncbi:hypothetical protein CC86DRAFT_306786, partial [Ophiobolus disseminans]
FIFKVDEIREHPDIVPMYTPTGMWMPSSNPGYNYRLVEGHGVSDLWWYHDENTIRQVSFSSPPDLSRSEFKTYSVFYSSGFGFWVLEGDATVPTLGEAWHPLTFDHDEMDLASYMTSAGSQSTLRVHSADQRWPHMLMPDIYHGPTALHKGYGGLVGELPIFLALIAFSMVPENLQQWLPLMRRAGSWQTHSLPHGRTHKRGVVVQVYTCPSTWAGGSSRQSLTEYELGRSMFGKYYN